MAFTYTFGRFDPPVPFTASDSQKIAAPITETTTINLEDYPIGYEMVKARVNYSGSALDKDYNVVFRWENLTSGSLLFAYQFTVKKGWNNFWVTSWIGHKAVGEIDAPGSYGVHIWAEGLFSKIITFTVAEEEEGWLVRAKRFILETLPAWIISIPKAIADVFNNAVEIAAIIIEKIPEAISNLKEWINVQLESLELVIPQWIIDTVNSVKNWWSDVTFYVSDKIQDVKAWVNNLLQDLSSIIPQWIIDIKNFFETVGTSIYDFLTKTVPDAVNWVIEKGVVVWNWISEKASDVWNWINEAGKDAVNWVSDTGVEIGNWLEEEGKPALKDLYDFLLKPYELVESAIIYIVQHAIPSKEERKKRWEEENELKEL